MNDNIPIFGKKKEESTLTTYKCDWPKCHYVFKCYIKISNGGTHSKVSTQIICPNCGNGLKTWG